jgi:hypothetical protein
MLHYTAHYQRYVWAMLNELDAGHQFTAEQIEAWQPQESSDRRGSGVARGQKGV